MGKTHDSVKQVDKSKLDKIVSFYKWHKKTYYLIAFQRAFTNDVGVNRSYEFN